MGVHKYAAYFTVALLMLCAGCFVVAGGERGNTISPADIRLQVRNEAGPYALDVVAWELANLCSASASADIKGPAATVFSSLEQNVTEALVVENFTVFPHVRVKLVTPPLLLVVSPRDRIVYFDRVLLSPGLSGGVMAEIEQGVDAHGLSSLVVQLGGFGAAYPAIVSPDMPPAHAVNAAVEEWAHQYLAFKPLGFLYLLDSLGVRQDPVIIVMNETLAGMIAQEVGSQVYGRYYLDTGSQVIAEREAAVDFEREMRATRVRVDELLAGGRIDEAERYMEDRRQYFNHNGYAIRKLNQAYFAFHGIYGQDPGAASPVYLEMLMLRNRCAGLSAFVDKVSAMTTYAELQRSVTGPPD